MSCKLIYKDIAPGAAEDASVSTSDAQSLSTISKLPLGESVPPIATLEPDMWILDGRFEIRDDQTIPFWSTAMSDADGAFTTPPTITITFDSQYTSLGIFLRFAPATGDYCDSVTITWYQGATQLDQKTFTPTSTAYFCANTVTAYNKVVITLNSTNKPYRYARLEYIVFGVTREFSIDELESVKILQEVDLISTEVAINTLDWKLRSIDGIDYIFQLKQPVEAYNGSSLVGVFYITGNKRLADKTYEIDCEDALSARASAQNLRGCKQRRRLLSLHCPIAPDDAE